MSIIKQQQYTKHIDIFHTSDFLKVDKKSLLDTWHFIIIITHYQGFLCGYAWVRRTWKWKWQKYSLYVSIVL